jgi:predicted enzyme related to lactoylglutathione lyase
VLTADTAVLEKPRRPARLSVPTMFNSISHHGLWVLDQDQARDFYVDKLGFQVTADVDLGFMRWLTVAPAQDPERHVLLELPGPPTMTEETAAQIRDLLTKGAMGLGMILTTDDCRETFDDLVAKGVDVTQEPTEQPYGIDCGIRDPFGNHIRISQPAAEMGEITDEVKQRWSGDLDEHEAP